MLLVLYVRVHTHNVSTHGWQRQDTKKANSKKSKEAKEEEKKETEKKDLGCLGGKKKKTMQNSRACLLLPAHTHIHTHTEKRLGAVSRVFAPFLAHST